MRANEVGQSEGECDRDSSDGLSFEDLGEGDYRERSVVMSRELVDAFVDLTDDRAPAHVDAVHARSLGFDSEIAHGLLVLSGYSRLLGMSLPGNRTVIHHLMGEMTAPVYLGDRLTYRVEVARLVPAVRSVQMSLSCTNQDGVYVNRGKAVCVFRR